MGCRLHGKELEALALHNSTHNGLAICIGQTHKINTTYSSVVQAGQDVIRYADKPITAVFHKCKVGFIGTKTVYDHITQSRLSMGVASTHD